MMRSRDNLLKLSEYCDEFLVHGVDVEGMRVGILVRRTLCKGVGSRSVCVDRRWWW